MVQDLEEHDDGGGEEEGGGAPAKKGGSKKLILFVAIPLVLVMGLAAGAYFTGLADPILGLVGIGGKEEKPPEGAAAPGGAQPVVQSVFYDLPDMLVNLNSPGRRQSYLKIRVSLELSNPMDQPRIEQMMPRIVDNFQVYLRELRVEDLQGAAGVYRLREELLSRVNGAVKPTKVNDVLFKEMLVQ
ncbi:MAG: flagellar basal body-associated FliL family protein [Alphaproteobacteria bacterium]|nr:flagellar basal body-associated FliL family protein [Alphaproteobacteria bacterium]